MKFPAAKKRIVLLPEREKERERGGDQTNTSNSSSFFPERLRRMASAWEKKKIFLFLLNSVAADPHSHHGRRMILKIILILASLSLSPPLSLSAFWLFTAADFLSLFQEEDGVPCNYWIIITIPTTTRPCRVSLSLFPFSYAAPGKSLRPKSRVSSISP